MFFPETLFARFTNIAHDNFPSSREMEVNLFEFTDFFGEFWNKINRELMAKFPRKKITLSKLSIMNYFKIVLAVLLLLCLLDMPYGFYILIRYVATVVFGYMAYSYYQENKNELAIAAGALAVLFQPLVKFALGRFVWNVVDVVAAVALIVLVFVETKNRKEH